MLLCCQLSLLLQSIMWNCVYCIQLYMMAMNIIIVIVKQYITISDKRKTAVGGWSANDRRGDNFKPQNQITELPLTAELKPELFPSLLFGFLG